MIGSLNGIVLLYRTGTVSRAALNPAPLSGWETRDVTYPSIYAHTYTILSH